MKKYFENSNPDEKNPNYLQIGGKMRNLQIKGTKFLIKDNEKLKKFIEQKKINKSIFVKDKLINLIIK